MHLQLKFKLREVIVTWEAVKMFNLSTSLFTDWFSILFSAKHKDFICCWRNEQIELFFFKDLRASCFYYNTKMTYMWLLPWKSNFLKIKIENLLYKLGIRFFSVSKTKGTSLVWIQNLEVLLSIFLICVVLYFLHVLSYLSAKWNVKLFLKFQTVALYTNLNNSSSKIDRLGCFLTCSIENLAEYFWFQNSPDGALWISEVLRHVKNPVKQCINNPTA